LKPTGLLCRPTACAAGLLSSLEGFRGHS
jgi:hypothetical protein